MGSILAIFEPYYKFNSSKTGQIADTKAIESDFGTIAKYLRMATKLVKDGKRK